MDDVRVTDALDVAFDSNFFCKTRDGIVVKSDRICRLYAMLGIIGSCSCSCSSSKPIWSDVKLTFELKRFNKIMRFNDVMYVPGSSTFKRIHLRKGDLLNFFVINDHYRGLNNVYETTVQITWLYEVS